MHKAWLIGGAIALLSGVPAPVLAAPSARVAQSIWQRFTSPEGRFSVLFPGQPQQLAQQIPYGDNQVSQLRLFYVERSQEDVVYAVAYNDFPAARDNLPPEIAEQALARGRDSAIRSLEAQLVAERRITLQQYPGREVRFRRRDGYVGRIRMYLAAVSDLGHGGGASGTPTHRQPERISGLLSTAGLRMERVACAVPSACRCPVPSSSLDGRQLNLFEHPATATQLGEALWAASFDRAQSSLHQLAPYETRLSVASVRALIDLYVPPTGILLDPFAGGGTIPLEAALQGRTVWANDWHPYASAIARGKLAAPPTARRALDTAKDLLADLETVAAQLDPMPPDAWVSAFFHPDTLREIRVAVHRCQQAKQDFLLACLLGILHHIRPGFLSYPVNQDAPYLRRATYPPDAFPQMYAYRDVRSRLLAKIQRVYRRSRLPAHWPQRDAQLWSLDARQLPIPNATVDTILTSPPHPGAFRYAANHRLRLWCLGQPDWQAIDARLMQPRTYSHQMTDCLRELHRVLRPKGYAGFLLVERQSPHQPAQVAENLAALAQTACPRGWLQAAIVDTPLPTRRQSRPHRSRLVERCLILRKQ